jgi:hypothetical protein
MTNVQVKFSASIKDLIEATNGVKAAIEGVAETAQRATESMRTFGELAGIGLSIKGIASFVGEQGKLGEEIERNAKFLGVSTTQMQEFDFMAKITGGDTAILAQSFARLELNLQRAATGTGPARAALSALGTNARQLIGIPLEAQLGKIADAFNRFGDGPNKDAIAMALFNRSARDMLPLLDGGSAGLRSMAAEADAHAVMTEHAVRALADMNRNAKLMKASLSALSGEIVASVTGIRNFGADVATSASNMTALIATGTLGEYTIKTLGYSAEIGALQILKLGVAMARLATFSFGSFAKDMAAINAQIEAVAKKEITDLDGMLAKAIAGLKKMLATVKAEGANTKPQAPAMDLDNKSLQEAIAHYQGMIKEIDEFYSLEKEHLAAAAQQHKITYDQETAALLSALNARKAGVDATFDAEIKALQNAGKNYEKAAEQKKAADQKWQLEHDKIVNDALQHDTQEWNSALGTIQSAWDSQLKGLLAGTTTWGQAMQHIFSDLAIKAIEQLEKIGVEKLASSLAGMFGGPSSILGGMFGGGGQNAAISANTSALATLTAAITGNTAAVAGETAATSGNFATQLGTILGPGSFLGFKAGAWELPSDTFAQVHKGEMIIPPGPAADLRAGIADTGSRAPQLPAFAQSSSIADSRSVNVNFTNNGGLTADTIQAHARTIAKAVADHWQNNPSTRPKGF